MPPRSQIPVDISRGQWSGGNPADMPDGYVRRMRNLVWEDAWVSRPPFTYDNLTAIRGLANWYSITTNATRLLAMQDDLISAAALYLKSASSETWSADQAGSDYVATTVVDSVTYRNQLIWSSNSSSGDGAVASFDGTFTEVAPLPAEFHPLSLAVFKERVIYGGARVNGVNLVGGGSLGGSGLAGGLDPTNWSLTSVTASSIVDGSSTLYRITPTATTGALLSFVCEGSSSAAGEHHQFQCRLRGTGQTYAMPVTIKIRYATARANLTVYAAGNVVIPAARNDFRYRCTVGGTSAAAPPAYPTTVGTTVSDGTVTWICDGSDVLVERETNIPSATVSAVPTYTQIVGSVAPKASTRVDVVIAFGTTVTPTIQLVPLDFAFDDGRSHDDPTNASWGQQFRRDDFEAPFLPSTTYEQGATVFLEDHVYYSEPLEPFRVRAQNFHRLTEVPGHVTAVRAVGDSLVVFKRQARWVFTYSEDVNYVILPVGGVRRGAGTPHPRAVDVADFDGSLFYIDTEAGGVYRWAVDSQPEELCGEAMLREMFNKSAATWVESQATANRALLTIDQRNKRAYVYVQKGVIHCYDIRRKAWSRIDAGGDTGVSASGYQILDMLYNPNGNVYVAFADSATGTAGLARLDATQSPAEDQISSSGTLDVHHDLILKPVEGRPRVDLALDQVFMHVDSSTPGQMASASVSFDQGATFEETDAAREIDTTDANYEPMRFSIWNSWGSMTPRILVSGKAGASALKISGLELDVRAAKKPEYPKR